MIIGAILGLIAIGLIASWPILNLFSAKAASAALNARTKALVEKNPQLRPAWDQALSDGVLTWPEAKGIVEKAGEKVDPE